MVIQYPNIDEDAIPKATISFNQINSNLTFVDISWLSVIITIIFCGIMIVLTMQRGFDNPIFLATVTFSLIGALKFFNAIEKIIRINCTKDGRAASRIHSAIHKAINAMIKEDTLTPSVQGILKSSRLNCNCETVYTFESILLGFLSIPVVLLTYKRIWLCLISLFVLREIIKALLNIGAFNFLQILFLRKPTNEEVYRIADLLSLNNHLFDDFEKHIQESKR